MSELTNEQKVLIMKSVLVIQSVSKDLQGLDRSQQLLGSESERLFSISLQLLDRYGLHPKQAMKESED